MNGMAADRRFCVQISCVKASQGFDWNQGTFWQGLVSVFLLHGDRVMVQQVGSSGLRSSGFSMLRGVHVSSFSPTVHQGNIFCTLWAGNVLISVSEEACVESIIVHGATR
jgi:hypothetical protein